MVKHGLKHSITILLENDIVEWLQSKQQEQQTDNPGYSISAGFVPADKVRPSIPSIIKSILKSRMAHEAKVLEQIKASGVEL